MLYREKQIATNLIRSALAQGWMVTVFDSIEGDGEMTVDQSTDFAEIFDSLDTTEGDTIYFTNQYGMFEGVVMLVWGNDDDLIADHSVRLIIDDDGNIQPQAAAA